VAGCCEYDNEPSCSVKYGDFLESLIRLASQEGFCPTKLDIRHLVQLTMCSGQTVGVRNEELDFNFSRSRSCYFSKCSEQCCGPTGLQ
jgi:hypothetical protein